MSRTLPIKSSSRAGRFKKKLVNAEALLIQAPQIATTLAPLADLHSRKLLPDSEFVSLYLITILNLRFPSTWLGAKRATPLDTHSMPLTLRKLSEFIPLEKNIQARLESFETLGDLIANFAFKSTPLTVNRSLLNWSTGKYALELMFRIPTPHEVLMQQKHGRRVVTVLSKLEQLQKFVLGERDALSFTMHDLIHADHFYHDNACYQGQLGFYGLLDQRLCAGDFRELMEDEKFKYEFEYLIADMNAYAIHLLKCFKSALVHYHPGKEDYFQTWLQRLTPTTSEQEAFTRLNGIGYNPHSDDAVLLGLLDRFKA